jgi:hypothetical protein
LIRREWGSYEVTPWDRLDKKFKIHFPRIYRPDVYYQTADFHPWLHYSPQLACLAFTLLVVVTSLWFGTFKLDFCAADHLKERFKNLQDFRKSRATRRKSSKRQVSAARRRRRPGSS